MREACGDLTQSAHICQYLNTASGSVSCKWQMMMMILIIIIIIVNHDQSWWWRWWWWWCISTTRSSACPVVPGRAPVREQNVSLEVQRAGDPEKVCWLTYPSEKYQSISQLGWWFTIVGKNKTVPNHQLLYAFILFHVHAAFAMHQLNLVLNSTVTQ